MHATSPPIDAAGQIAVGGAARRSCVHTATNRYRYKPPTAPRIETHNGGNSARAGSLTPLRRSVAAQAPWPIRGRASPEAPGSRPARGSISIRSPQLLHPADTKLCPSWMMRPAFAMNKVFKRLTLLGTALTAVSLTLFASAAYANAR